MKYNLEIDNSVLEDEIMKCVVGKAVDEIESRIFEGDRYSVLRRLYKENIQKGLREILRAREPEIIEKAVAEAAAILARKALPKVMERLIDKREETEAPK